MQFLQSCHPPNLFYYSPSSLNYWLWATIVQHSWMKPSWGNNSWKVSNKSPVLVGGLTRKYYLGGTWEREGTSEISAISLSSSHTCSLKPHCKQDILLDKPSGEKGHVIPCLASWAVRIMSINGSKITNKLFLWWGWYLWAKIDSWPLPGQVPAIILARSQKWFPLHPFLELSEWGWLKIIQLLSCLRWD